MIIAGGYEAAGTTAKIVSRADQEGPGRGGLECSGARCWWIGSGRQVAALLGLLGLRRAWTRLGLVEPTRGER